MHLNRIMITGASNGLGKELALTFAKNNFDLLICGKKIKDLENLKNDLEAKYKISCIISCGDLLEKKYLLELIELCKKENVSVLINNAALLCEGKPITELTEKYIEESIELNYKIPILLIKNLFKNLKNIIMINSIAGISPKKNRTIYCSTKSALKMFSETLILETDKDILNVFLSKLKKNDNDYGLNIQEVCSMIFSSFTKKDKVLIIDGKK